MPPSGSVANANTREAEKTEAGRRFLLQGEVVQDNRPWPMPGDEWVMNGKVEEHFRPNPAKRKEILERLLDPFLSEEETLAVLMVSKTRLREAVNRRHLAMFRDLSGARYFRLSEVLELAQALGQGQPGEQA